MAVTIEFRVVAHSVMRCVLFVLLPLSLLVLTSFLVTVTVMFVAVRIGLLWICVVLLVLSVWCHPYHSAW